MSFHQGWLYPTHCGHWCCHIQDCEQHYHLHLPADCLDCHRSTT